MEPGSQGQRWAGGFLPSLRSPSFSPHGRPILFGLCCDLPCAPLPSPLASPCFRVNLQPRRWHACFPRKCWEPERKKLSEW